MENGVHLTWENLSLLRSLNNEKERPKTAILKNITGEAISGSLVAIMGPSGSGKTSLIGALSGRIKDTIGTIKINNKIAKNNDIAQACGYLHQDDIFADCLTVNEHLKFMGAFKTNASKGDLQCIISDLLFEMNLENCKDTVLKVLSGGEKRRVSLAAELLSDPWILFGDEPTSGLDSYTAIMIIEKLQNLASRGKLIMVSVHQPSSQLFEYFSHVLMLSEGRLVFHGTKFDLVNFFDNMDYICPKGYNQAEYYIKCITILPGKENESLGRIRKICESYAKIYGTQPMQNNSVKVATNGINKVAYKRNCFVELSWLLWREIISKRQQFQNDIVHFGLRMLAAATIGITYSVLFMDGASKFQNADGFLIFVCTEIIFVPMYAVIYEFPEEFVVCLREKYLYSSHSYFISKVIMTIPSGILQSFCYFGLTQILFNFVGSMDIFLKMIFVFTVACFCASTWGLCLSAVFNSWERLQLFLVPFEMMSLAVTGFWMNINSLSKYIYWIRYTSVFSYTFEAISIIQWTQTKHKGSDCMDLNTTSCDTQTLSGLEHLRQNGFHTDRLYYLYDVFYMLVLSLFYCIIGFCGILRTRFNYTSY